MSRREYYDDMADEGYDRWRDENSEEWGQTYDEMIGPMHNGEWRSNKYQFLAAGALPGEVS